MVNNTCKEAIKMISEMQILKLQKAMKLTKDRLLFERYQEVKLIFEVANRMKL